jgi:hypothetical protein
MDNTSTTKMRRREFTTAERQKILDYSNGVCACCKKKLTLESMTIDHLFPLHKGGDNSEINLVALCGTCNNNKSNALYDSLDLMRYVPVDRRADYIEYHIKMLAENREKLGLMQCDIKEFHFIPDSVKYVVYQNMKRHGKKKDLARILKSGEAVLTLSRAYTGEAEEIYQFIKDRIHTNSQMYDNEFKVLGAIKNDCVFVLRNKNTLCGVFILKRLNEYNKIPLVQLNTIEMNSRLRQKYLFTMAYASSFVDELVFSKIMSYFMEQLERTGAIPIYFGEINDCFTGTEQKDLIRIPYEIDNIQGDIGFMQLNNHKQMYKRSMHYAVEHGALTEDELDDYAEAILGYNEDDSDGYERDIYDKIAKYDKKIISCYMNELR